MNNNFIKNTVSVTNINAQQICDIIKIEDINIASFVQNSKLLVKNLKETAIELRKIVKSKETYISNININNANNSDLYLEGSSDIECIKNIANVLRYSANALLKIIKDCSAAGDVNRYVRLRILNNLYNTVL